MERVSIKMRNVVIGGLVAASLGGCASGPPILPAVVEYAGSSCDDTPDLATAVDITPMEDKRIWTVPVDVDGATPCLFMEGSMTPYVVMKLPPKGSSKALEIGALTEPRRTFAPQIALMDADGTVTRRMAPVNYLYRGGILSVQFAHAEGEEYALVTANHGVVGDVNDRLVASISSTTVYTGYGASNWNSGTERIVSQRFSYEGTLLAKVYRLEDDD